MTIFNESLVSVVIPTYNQGNYIDACLNSIINQKYKNIEIIIQDSFSSDNTAKVCLDKTEIDYRIQYFCEKDKGQSDAINRGLRKSRGKYWTWLCSDDMLADPNAISILISALENNWNSDEFVGAFGLAAYIDNAGKKIGPYFQLKKNVSFNDFYSQWPLSQPSCILKRDNVLEVGGVNEELNLGMDLDLFLKLLRNNKSLLFVDVDVALVRIQAESKSVKYKKQTALTALKILGQHASRKQVLSHSDYYKELVYHALSIIPSNVYPFVPARNRLLHNYWDRVEAHKTCWHYQIFFFIFRFQVAKFLDKGIFYIFSLWTIWKLRLSHYDV
jgi:glycosyltransferase involved in cell wall biosynthesis